MQGRTCGLHIPTHYLRHYVAFALQESDSTAHLPGCRGWQQRGIAAVNSRLEVSSLLAALQTLAFPLENVTYIAFPSTLLTPKPLT